MFGKSLQPEAIFFSLKMHKSVWRPGSAQRHRGTYSDPPDPTLAGFRGSLGGKEGQEREGTKGGKRSGTKLRNVNAP